MGTTAQTRFRVLCRRRRLWRVDWSSCHRGVLGRSLCSKNRARWAKTRRKSEILRFEQLRFDRLLFAQRELRAMDAAGMLENHATNAIHVGARKVDIGAGPSRISVSTTTRRSGCSCSIRRCHGRAAWTVELARHVQRQPGRRQHSARAPPRMEARRRGILGRRERPRRYASKTMRYHHTGQAPAERSRGIARAQLTAVTFAPPRAGGFVGTHGGLRRRRRRRR